MIGFGGATRVYLATGATDMRKGFEGLYALSRDRIGEDPLSGHVFVFCNGPPDTGEGSLLGWERALGLCEAAGKGAIQLAGGGGGMRAGEAGA